MEDAVLGIYAGGGTRCRRVLGPSWTAENGL